MDEELTKLKERVEQLEVQLAGCGVAALGGIKSENRAHKGSFGWSPAYQNVVDLRIKYEDILKYAPIIK